MEITKEYILSEIDDLESEIAKAQAFVLQAQGAICTHKAILQRLEYDAHIPKAPDTRD